MSIGANLGQYFCANIQFKKSGDSLGALNPLNHPMGTPVGKLSARA